MTSGPGFQLAHHPHLTARDGLSDGRANIREEEREAHMSFMGRWCLVPVDSGTIDHYAPLLQPAIDEEADQSSEFLQWWRTLADTKEARLQFLEAAAPYALAEHLRVVYEAWKRGHDAPLPHIAVTVRKRYPAAALAYAAGPERFRLTLHQNLLPRFTPR
ncbi:hypothetical protein LN042_23320 [Kitasatospora sp. RB6PN24]|uniref:hypothetical protein n=1 Tax=Kitasatospora humi TaxID=2893891 RepID=UPI001E46524C|nr:hypothetical protein [Kitasatospora humi]MCC9309968.1 hypothetical protein [Kitasatospora humi]